MKNELTNLQTTKRPNAVFIESAVDFIRTYADQTHHGKEEDILFRELKKKPLSKEHTIIMGELIHEHVMGRKTTRSLLAAKNQYFTGHKEAFDIILKQLEWLIDFYPKHIAKEDKHFFLPVMAYFSPKDLSLMLEEGRQFDRKMIHKKYDSLTRELENSYNMQKPKRPANWLEFL